MRAGSLAWVALLLAAGCQLREPRVDDPDYFPMAKGTRWIYQAHAEDVGLKQPVDTNVVCEVLETADRDRVKAALMRGFPIQLGPDALASGAPAESTLINVLSSQFHLLDGDAFKRVSDTNDYLVGLVDESTEFLEVPLAADKRFAAYDSITRPDGWYCWRVESVEDKRLSGIRGVSPLRRYRTYQLAYRTNPDHQILVFAPGIGILSYDYSHHGTLSEVHLKLVEFQGGGKLSDDGA